MNGYLNEFHEKNYGMLFNPTFKIKNYAEYREKEDEMFNNISDEEIDRIDSELDEFESKNPAFFPMLKERSMKSDANYSGYNP
jgi:hypothetical protein